MAIYLTCGKQFSIISYKTIITSAVWAPVITDGNIDHFIAYDMM